MEIEQRVMFVPLTQCNWQFICSVLSLWTSSTHACIFITMATQFIEQEVWTKVNERLNPLTIHHYARYYSGRVVAVVCLCACTPVCVCVGACMHFFASVWIRLQRVSLSILSALYPRLWQLLFSWSLVNNTSATSILPRGEHHSAGSRAQPDPPLSVPPLIHSFGRQNPSPLGTCLTEGKNRDEIAGRGSIPSILLSISAVIHQPVVVVVVDVAAVVWLDTALVPRHWKWGSWIMVKQRDVSQGEIIWGMFFFEM